MRSFWAIPEVCATKITTCGRNEKKKIRITASTRRSLFCFGKKRVFLVEKRLLVAPTLFEGEIMPVDHAKFPIFLHVKKDVER